MKSMNDVKVGDVVRGLSQSQQRIIDMVVDRLAFQFNTFVGVSGREVNKDGTVRSRAKNYIGLGLPGAHEGFTYFEDYQTGERTTGGWTYPPIAVVQNDKRGKWAEPVRALGVGATIDFDCTSREVDSIRNVVSRERRNWLRRYKVEQTLSGCAVTRIT